MKRNHISKPLKIQLGIRVFMVGLFAIMGQFALAAMAFAWPVAVPWSYAFHLTPAEEKEREDLLKAIEDRNQAAYKKIQEEMKQMVAGMKFGTLTKEQFDQEFEKITSKLKELDAEKFKQFEQSLQKYEKKLEEATEALKVQGTELKKMKESGGPATEEGMTPFRTKLREFLKSPDWQTVVESNGRQKAGFEVKAVDMTSSYTGSSRVLITGRSPRILDYPSITRLNLRDVLTTGPIDTAFLAYLEVYDWIRNAGTVSENGMLPESSFKLRETTTDVKRIGTFVNLSKRMLKSVPFVEGYLAQQLPALVRYAEDFQLLYGDGQGTNPMGLTKTARDFTTEINATLTGAAGSISSIESYDLGTKTLVNFAANQDIMNGDIITIAGATAGAPATAYNKAHTAIVKSPRQIMLEVAYSADPTAAWTFTVNNRFKDSVPNVQEIDVIKVARSLVTRREYNATAVVLNPDTVTAIEMLKKNDLDYLNVDRMDNGVMRIAGVPVIETSAMPAGKFLIGDFTLAAALLDYTPLILEFSESTQEKLTNTVVAIIQEEIMFPVFNKYMFVYGDFVSAKAAIGV